MKKRGLVGRKKDNSLKIFFVLFASVVFVVSSAEFVLGLAGDGSWAFSWYKHTGTDRVGDDDWFNMESGAGTNELKVFIDGKGWGNCWVTYPFMPNGNYPFGDNITASNPVLDDIAGPTSWENYFRSWNAFPHTVGGVLTDWCDKPAHDQGIGYAATNVPEVGTCTDRVTLHGTGGCTQEKKHRMATYITFVYASQTYQKTFNIDVDDGVDLFVWKNCGTTFDASSCTRSFHDYHNGPWNGDIIMDLTEGWNVIQFMYVQDAGEAEFKIYDSESNKLSNDPNIVAMNSQGVTTLEEVCYDGVDNDNDGLIDCADTNSDIGTACSVGVICNINGEAKCGTDAVCHEINCLNSVDDDNDGSTDSDDLDCESEETCSINTYPGCGNDCYNTEWVWSEDEFVEGVYNGYCCGDDSSEHYWYYYVDETLCTGNTCLDILTNTEDNGCCPNPTDCVYGGECFPHGSYIDAISAVCIGRGEAEKELEIYTTILDNSASVGKYTSIAANFNYVHISYFDDPNNKIQYIKSDDGGATWSSPTVVVASVITDAYPSIAVANNNVHIIYYRSRTLSYVKSPDNGDTWESPINLVTNMPQEGGPTSIAANSNNVHIGYYMGHKLKYNKSTDNGATWSTTSGNVDNMLFGPFSIATDSNNNVHMSYRFGGLRYARLNNGETTWFKKTVDDEGNVGDWSSIATDQYGNIHISYYDDTNNNLKYAVSVDDGITWTNTTVDNDGNNTGKYTSIAVDSRRIHISYYDQTNGNLKYAKSSDGGNSWSTTTIDDGGMNDNDVGSFSSIAVDPYNNVHISYYDASEQALKYARIS